MMSSPAHGMSKPQIFYSVLVPAKGAKNICSFCLNTAVGSIVLKKGFSSYFVRNLKQALFM